MKTILNSRPAPSMIVALVALFVAMGGVSYAAATIGSAQIKNNSVRSKDIRNSDVRGKDIRTGTLGSSDVKNDALTGSDVLESSLGKVPSAGTADRANTAGFAGSAGNAGTVGGVAASALQRKVRWVQVDGSGDIRAQTGGITVTRDLEGLYSVNFGASTVNGMLTATGAELGADIVMVNAQRCGNPPLGTTCLGANTPNRVIVNTDDPNVAGLNDADFYLGLVQ